MTDKERDNLLYRPNDQPVKEYLSDAEFTHTSVPDMPYEEPDEPGKKVYDPTPGDIEEQLYELTLMIKDLPDDVQFWGDSVDKLARRNAIAFPGGYRIKDVPEEKKVTNNVSPNPTNVINHIPQKMNPSLSKLPNLFPTPTNIAIKVQQPKTLVQLIQETYDADQIHLDQYYLEQLQIIMQKYFQKMLMTMNEAGLESINDLTKEFDGDSVVIPSGQSLEHLRDFICRSQIARNQQTRLFRKTHSVDRTLQHMRSWHAAEQERERYYDEKYRDSGTYVESHSNALLREARSSYDTGYSSALYSMYKYLDSSVMVMNDILTATAKEAQAKAMLLKAGVNIYAFDNSLNEAAEGGELGNSGQAGDGSGSAEVVNGTASGDKSADSSNTSSSDSETTEESTEGTGKPLNSADDSGIKAPNGNNYSQNDIDYLVSKGYSKDDAVYALSQDKKYKAAEKKAETSSEKKEADSKTTTPKQSGKLTNVKAPNGLYYTQNDLDYLMKNQGYSYNQAIYQLSQDKKYSADDSKESKGFFEEASGTTSSSASSSDDSKKSEAQKAVENVEKITGNKYGAVGGGFGSESSSSSINLADSLEEGIKNLFKHKKKSSSKTISAKNYEKSNGTVDIDAYEKILGDKIPEYDRIKDDDSIAVRKAKLKAQAKILEEAGYTVEGDNTADTVTKDTKSMSPSEDSNNSTNSQPEMSEEERKKTQDAIDWYNAMNGTSVSIEDANQIAWP